MSEYYYPIIYFLAAAILVFVAYKSFFVRRPGLFTWHMFTNCSLAYFYLTDGEQEINPWDYLPHSQLYIHPYDIHRLLEFLREKNIKASGEIVLVMNEEILDLHVTDSNVD